MNRDELVVRLVDFSAPLGPFTTPEEREDQWRRWLLSVDENSVPLFFELLTHPPDPQKYAPMDSGEFEFEIVEALTFIFLRDPLRGLNMMAPLLENAAARPALIEVIGGLGREEGVDCLERLISRSDLTQDEWVRLACALGEIGGEAGKVMLEKMQALPVASDVSVKREIETALVYCQNR